MASKEVMKRNLASVILGAWLAVPGWASAQPLPAEAFGGALWGALIGGVIGADRHEAFSGNGAAIGAGIGLAAGTLAGWARSARSESQAVLVPAPVVSSVHVGVGYGRGWGRCRGGWVGYSATLTPVASVATAPVQPGSYVWPATVAGAASGALIGAGTESVGKGLAVGTAAGLLVGTVAEQHARAGQAGKAHPTPAASPAPPPARQTPAPPGLPSPHAQIHSQPCPTSTYYWTDPPAVSDAPRVPDAPRF